MLSVTTNELTAVLTTICHVHL